MLLVLPLSEDYNSSAETWSSIEANLATICSCLPAVAAVDCACFAGWLWVGEVVAAGEGEFGAVSGGQGEGRMRVLVGLGMRMGVEVLLGVDV